MTRKDGNGGTAVQVFFRLSSFLILAQQITILKVDTEGYGSSVFDGPYDTLKHVEYVITKIKECNSHAKRDPVHRIMQVEISHSCTLLEISFRRSYIHQLLQVVHDIINIVVSKLQEE